MSDEKIFSEIKGIFSWLEQQKKNETQEQIDLEAMKPSEKSNQTCNQLKDLLKFLSVEASNVNFSLFIKKRKKLKHQMNQPILKGRNQKQLLKVKILFENKIKNQEFIKIFVKNEDELLSEATQLKTAFKNLTEDKNEETIPIDRLKKVLELYDKKYKTSVKLNCFLLQQQMEKILTEVNSSPSVKNGNFNYKEYIENQFNIKKKSQ